MFTNPDNPPLRTSGNDNRFEDRILLLCKKRPISRALLPMLDTAFGRKKCEVLREKKHHLDLNLEAQIRKIQTSKRSKHITTLRQQQKTCQVDHPLAITWPSGSMRTHQDSCRTTSVSHQSLGGSPLHSAADENSSAMQFPLNSWPSARHQTAQACARYPASPITTAGGRGHHASRGTSERRCNHLTSTTVRQKSEWSSKFP